MMNSLRFWAVMTLLVAGAAAYADEVNTNKIAQLRETADSLHSVGRSDSAAIIGQQAIALAMKSGNPAQIVGTHSAQGVFLRSLGKINEALQSYENALQIVTSGKFREHPDQETIEEIASLYINLSVLNLDMAHKEEAKANALHAGEWTERSTNAEFRSQVFGVVGSVLTGTGNLPDALEYSERAYEDALESKNETAAFRAAAYTLLIASRLDRQEAARFWRKKCNELLPRIQSTMALLTYYQVECSIHLKSGNSTTAIEYFKKILSLEGIEKLPFVQSDCYSNMHLAYAHLGNYKEAYATLLKGNEVRDSLYEKEKAESLRKLTVKYETKEKELALSQSEARRATTLIWLLASITLSLALAIALIVYASRQRRQRMVKEMEFAHLRADIGRKLTEQYVEGLENERERMARELHDGVCNDLLAIQMNISNGISELSTAKLIDSCRESVRRISHELMPPEFSYATLDEVIRYYVSKQAEAHKQDLHICYASSTTAGWDTIDDRTALEVYRIVQEAVGNAIKHSGAKEIRVSLNRNGDSLHATIEDNGGIQPNGQRGLGMNSMNKRAGSINGHITLHRPATGGTQVMLTVALR